MLHVMMGLTIVRKPEALIIPEDAASCTSSKSSTSSMCLHTIAAHAKKYKLKYVYNTLLILLFYDSIEARRSNANSATIHPFN